MKHNVYDELSDGIDVHCLCCKQYLYSILQPCEEDKSGICDDCLYKFDEYIKLYKEHKKVCKRKEKEDYFLISKNEIDEIKKLLLKLLTKTQPNWP